MTRSEGTAPMVRRRSNRGIAVLAAIPLAFAIAALAPAPASAQQQPAPAPLPQPQVGDVAPAFTLVGATRYGILRDSIRLTDFRGQVVVLAFFPKARTKG